MDSKSISQGNSEVTIMSASPAKITKSTGSWMSFIKPAPGARLRLFCFPYAGGGSMIFRNWAAGLPSTVEVAALRLPGREGRLSEKPFTSLASLVRTINEVLEPYLDKPFAFFGHSMGAVIGYELARLLQTERGLEPSHLFVSGRRAPQYPDDNRHTSALPEKEFVEELKRLNGTPREVLDHPELMEMMIPVLRADFSVCQGYEYTPGPPLNCPITAYGGLNDTDVTRETLEGWREHTTSTFTLRMLEGDHFFLHSSQSLLLRVLSQALHKLF
jgi:medium-chain acyl-[acyl-carrier-protein] hydrolase